MPADPRTHHALDAVIHTARTRARHQQAHRLAASLCTLLSIASGSHLVAFLTDNPATRTNEAAVADWVQVQLSDASLPTGRAALEVLGQRLGRILAAIAGGQAC